MAEWYSGNLVLIKKLNRTLNHRYHRAQRQTRNNDADMRLQHRFTDMNMGERIFSGLSEPVGCY